LIGSLIGFSIEFSAYENYLRKSKMENWLIAIEQLFHNTDINFVTHPQTNRPQNPPLRHRTLHRKNEISLRITSWDQIET